MNPNFDKGNGLLPCIIQDADTRRVLMLGYMNAEALQKTQDEGLVTFYSRSKQRLWTKGESSKNYLRVVSVNLDCDEDTLLIQARPDGPTCHTGTDTCWGETNTAGAAFLETLEAVIRDRKQNPKEGSYTNHLFNKGLNKIAQKVGEEAVEVVIEAKDNNRDLFLNESADLMFHFLVLLAEKDVALAEVMKVLQERHQ